MEKGSVDHLECIKVFVDVLSPGRILQQSDTGVELISDAKEQLRRRDGMRVSSRVKRATCE